MSRAVKTPAFATARPSLRIFDTSSSLSTAGAKAAQWLINGYRASIIVWTAEEWERLAERPHDAQLHPSGVWCALRVE